MPVVKCPRVGEYACTARTAEGLCTRDVVVLEGPDASCSYLHEQNVLREQLRIKEVNKGEGKKITAFWDNGINEEAGERTD